MRQISKKQSRINRELNRIKRKLAYENDHCRICGARAVDLAHLLPRSMYPEHQAEEWNVTLLCRRCHTQFDDNVEFRQKYKHIARHIKNIDELAYNRYYENWR